MMTEPEQLSLFPEPEAVQLPLFEEPAPEVKSPKRAGRYLALDDPARPRAKFIKERRR
jgi:hypothetical protein